eukprot:TRINITY_DN3194_c0_g1_i1.p1 TRINITY_DN3194_c0_g1~~TRINITY_DN3194_c0_g1_i1.p1  ORF type:complete len:441 (+),score=118.89 TRINITY_DN3194_c0_g1_i1:247-1569(+)
MQQHLIPMKDFCHSNLTVLFSFKAVLIGLPLPIQSNHNMDAWKQQATKVPSVSNSLPLARYYRSARELWQQGQIYLKSNNNGYAYVHLTRFAIFVLEQLPKHRDYNDKRYKKDKSEFIKLCDQALMDLEHVKPLLEAEVELQEQQLLLEQAQLQNAKNQQLKQQQLELAEQERKKNTVQGDLWKRPLYDTQTDPEEDDWSLFTSTIENNDDFVLPQNQPQYESFDADQFLIDMGILSTESSSSSSSSSSEMTVAHETGINAPVSGEGMRYLFIPKKLINDFYDTALDNTQNGIETCGLLAGSLIDNALYINTLILPKQHGTTDTCTTSSEEDIFAYQLENDLLSLGWIHTHPTQPCFLSSVDLHTHCTYQQMLSESIAIVLSPTSSPNYGIFSLTPFGIDTIQACTETGFHSHEAVSAIYQHSRHVMISNSLDYNVVDLR